MANAKLTQRILQARAALQAGQDARYQTRTRTATAVVTAVNRDASTGHLDSVVVATIDGVADQRIFVGAGVGVRVGDALRVENRGKALAPDWSLVGKLGSSAGAEGLLDVDRILSTPTGLTLTTAVYAPSPGNIRARVTATWNQIGDWESPRLYEAQLRRDADSSITPISVAHTPNAGAGATASFSANGLEPGIDYSVRVRAVGYGGGVGGWSAWASVTASADTTAPATPTGLTAETVDDYHLQWRWTANTEADLAYYEISLSLDGSSTLAGWPRTTGSTPAYGTTVLPGQGYYARVRATDSSGNASGWTAWTGPFSTTVRPSLAGLVYLQPWTELSADLTSGATSMDVVADIYSSGEFVHLLTVAGVGEVVKVTSAPSSITGGYRYTITRNVDGGGASAFDAGTRGYTLGQRGFILADSRDDGGHTDTPFLDIYAWDSPYTGTWANRVQKVRLGKLDGLSDPSFGTLSGFGLWADNVYLHGQIAITNQGDIDLGNLSGDLDDIGDGSTYGKIRQTILGAGYIQVGSGTKDSTLSGWKIDETEIVGQLSGVDQVSLNTSGQMVAGAGAIVLGAAGMEIDSITGKFGGATIAWKDGATTDMTLGPVVDLGSVIETVIESRTPLRLRSTTDGVNLSPALGYGVNIHDGSIAAPLWAGALSVGTITTDGGTNTWDLAGYTATAPTATGYVTVTINGTAYKLIAAT